MLYEVQVRREAIGVDRAIRTTQYRAVRHARAGLTINREARAILTKPVSRIVENAGKAVLDIVVGGCKHLFLGIVEGSVGVVGKCHRGSHRVHVLRIGPGIAEADIPAVIKGLEEAESQRLRLVSFGAVGQHKRGQSRRIVDRVPVTEIIVLTGKVQIAMLVDGRIVTSGDQSIGGQHIPVTELPGHAQRVLPLGRCFKVRVQVHDLEVAAVTRCNLLSLLRGYTPAGTARWRG